MLKGTFFMLPSENVCAAAAFHSQHFPPLALSLSPRKMCAHGGGEVSEWRRRENVSFSTMFMRVLQSSVDF